MKKLIVSLLIVAVVMVAAMTVWADELVEVPEEELAKESVLPVFPKRISLMNRLVVTEGRFDLNLAYGMALSEPIFDVSRFGVSAYYHFNENHALGLLFTKNSNALSVYAKQLKDKYDLNFQRAPGPDSTMMADWNWKMFYGKMSLTKHTTMNFSLYTTLAGGMTKYVHKSYPALAGGIGQKFYLGKHFAVRFDLRLYAHQAPIPFKEGVLKSNQTATYNDFSERITYTSVLDAGLSWLF